MDILYPLRRIHGKLHWERKKWQKNLSMIRYIRFPLGKKAFIIGSPTHINLGDSAIFISENIFLEKLNLPIRHIKEITYSEYYEFKSYLPKWISHSSPIFGLGGGNMGNQWPHEERIRQDIISDFSDNSMIVFPQTIYFLPNSKSDIEKAASCYNNHTHLKIVAREKTSERIMKDLFPNASVLLTPDIVLSSTMEDFGAVEQKRKGALMCVRSDEEKSVNNSVWDELEQYLLGLGISVARTDMYSDCPITKENRKDCVRKKMQEFCGAEIVVTDRLHGMIFAALTGTPCIVFSNYNHKVKGTYEWINYLPYIRYVESVKDAESVIPSLLQMKDCKYDSTPLNPYFDTLGKEVLVQCQ